MGSSNKDINAAYIALWKSKNKNLVDIDTDGEYLIYQNEKIDIREIYMQDILRNPTIFASINQISSNKLIQIIKTHLEAIKIKNIELEEKVRRYNMNEQPISKNIDITPARYFELIAKTEEELNSNAIYLLQIENFNKKINNFQELAEEGMLTEPSASILAEYNNLTRTLLRKENRTAQEDEIVSQIVPEQIDENQNNIVQMRTRTKKNQHYMPTNKAGHIDAVIILIMLLNIGFIIAMTILGNR